MLIIGIAGGTGSGKTTVVKKIRESLPEGAVAVIPQDSYYNDQTDMPLEERKKTNFDHPDALNGRCFPTRLPNCVPDAPLSSPPTLTSPARV